MYGDNRAWKERMLQEKKGLEGLLLKLAGLFDCKEERKVSFSSPKEGEVPKDKVFANSDATKF